MNHDPLLIEIGFVTYMDRREHIASDGKLVQFWDRLQPQIRKVASEFGLELECYSSSFYALGCGLDPDNSGRCTVCNAWVSAQNKPKIIGGLELGRNTRGSSIAPSIFPESLRCIVF